MICFACLFAWFDNVFAFVGLLVLVICGVLGLYFSCDFLAGGWGLLVLYYSDANLVVGFVCTALLICVKF